MLTLGEKLLLGVVVFVMIGLLGVELNANTVLNNNCLMPVHTSSLIYKDSIHSTYTNYSSVHFFYLTDIIPIGKAFMSIGDVLIFVSIFFIVYFYTRFIIIKRLEGKRR